MHGGLMYFTPFHYFDYLYYMVQNCNSKKLTKKSRQKADLSKKSQLFSTSIC